MTVQSSHSAKILKLLTEISGVIGYMEEDYDGQIRHWEKQAQERVGRQYHNREKVAAFLLGFLLGSAVILILVGIFHYIHP